MSLWAVVEIDLKASKIKGNLIKNSEDKNKQKRKMEAQEETQRMQEYTGKQQSNFLKGFYNELTELGQWLVKIDVRWDQLTECTASE